MKKIVTAAFFAASLIAGSAASAAVVVFNSGSIPVAANTVTAADISIGSTVNATEILFLGDTAEFKFTALERVRVGTISLSGTGTQSNLQLILSGLSFPAADNFQSVGGTPSAGFAGSTLAGFDLQTGDMFSIFWDANGATSAGVTAFFETTAVPVPAALPLLAGGIAALGLVRRKKAKAATA